MKKKTITITIEDVPSAHPDSYLGKRFCVKDPMSKSAFFAVCRHAMIASDGKLYVSRSKEVFYCVEDCIFEVQMFSLDETEKDD